MIHPTAIIDSQARLAEGVSVGAYSVIGSDVSIGRGTHIGPHVVIEGPCTIGEDNKFYQFSSIGAAPQDKKYAGEYTSLVIGDRNTIRECVTLNRGTIQDKGVTRIGNDNLIMAYVHVAHDCEIGNNVILANNASLAGHVTVQDFAILGGFTLVHQFCSLGAHIFTGMNSVISKDVPPYLMVSGHMAEPHGLNTEGLKRRKFSSEAIADLRKAYKILFRSNLTTDEAMPEMLKLAERSSEVAVMVDFLNNNVTRGIIR